MGPTYKPNTYQVVLQNVKFNDDEESGPLKNGEYRLFANLGSEWFFLNEIPRVSIILVEGVGDLGSGESFAINKRFLVTLPQEAELLKYILMDVYSRHNGIVFSSCSTIRVLEFITLLQNSPSTVLLEQIKD